MAFAFSDLGQSAGNSSDIVDGRHVHSLPV